MNAIEYIAKAAWDEYRHQLLPTCGKGEYAGLMCQWKDLGEHNQQVWKAVVIRVTGKLLIECRKLEAEEEANKS